MFVNYARNLPERSCREAFTEAFTEVFTELFPELEERGILTENPSVTHSGRLRDTAAHADDGRKSNLNMETKCN